MKKQSYSKIEKIKHFQNSHEQIKTHVHVTGILQT